MSEYMFEGVLRSPDELKAIARYRASEIERLTVERDAWKESRDFRVKEHLEDKDRIAKLEGELYHAEIYGADQWLRAENLLAELDTEKLGTFILNHNYKVITSRVAELEAACTEQIELCPERTVPRIWTALGVTE